MDDEKRVYDDLEIICYHGAHKLWALGVAFPSLVVWGLGVPFFAFVLLSRKKNKLKVLEVKERYGFLYNGYKHEFYYWEVILMYRKILIVVIAYVIVNLGVII